MALITDYVKPSVLTEVSRRVAAEAIQKDSGSYNFISRFGTHEHVDDVEYRLTPGQDDVPTMARFRAWDTQNPLASDGGVAELAGELAPLGQRRLITEWGRQQMKRGGDDRFVPTLGKYAKSTTLATIVRSEKAYIDTVLTGKTTLTAERGVTQEADWGRNAALTLAIGKKWSDPATSDPLNDLLGIQETINKAGLVFVMNPSTFALMRRSANLAKQYTTMGGFTPSVLTNDQIAGSFSAYGLNVATYDATYRENGQDVALLPHGKIIATTPGAGSFVWGVTREAMEPEYGIQESAWSGIVAGHYRTDHPIQDWVNAAAVGFPVLALPNYTAGITVI